MTNITKTTISTIDHADSRSSPPGLKRLVSLWTAISRDAGEATAVVDAAVADEAVADEDEVEAVVETVAVAISETAVRTKSYLQHPNNQ